MQLASVCSHSNSNSWAFLVAISDTQAIRTSLWWEIPLAHVVKQTNIKLIAFMNRSLFSRDCILKHLSELSLCYLRILYLRGHSAIDVFLDCNFHGIIIIFLVFFLDIFSSIVCIPWPHNQLRVHVKQIGLWIVAEWTLTFAVYKNVRWRCALTLRLIKSVFKVVNGCWIR